MPELPEVETMRRAAAAAVGRLVARATAPRSRRLKPIRIVPALPTLHRRVSGRRLTAVDRAGKRLVFRLAGGLVLVVEPRMSGLVTWDAPPDEEHVRLALEFRGRAPRRLLFWDRRGLGSVRLLSDAQWRRERTRRPLGPDALDVDLAAFRARLGGLRRPIKTALLDQRLLAGVGNIYACEMLHAARVHPQRRCCQLTAAQWRRLHGAMRRILEEAIRCEGSTLGDGTYRAKQGRPGRYQSRHQVYGRQADRCRTCRRGRIRRTVLAGRATYFCPVCQRPPRR